ncbi:MAG: hypothetical protein BCS36_01325 [Desulfovibrio sp. MES5]|nr:MAG: hypothetical protein BCS36_01325 [Desulfovibrio sp. MES5]
MPLTAQAADGVVWPDRTRLPSFFHAACRDLRQSCSAPFCRQLPELQGGMCGILPCALLPRP